ncbi:hypothetical protein GSI_11513 [Ganoderma sinense ZZ0214-1]|uniref:Uncharacterized protein n=1 Tax=Ganoderma sinense ZZ0214-1 TaxID=1077348 RepID=A0A2G8RSF2_9APHY|nr:hypothetical protein GSI_14193 [Ganoderma sinense ZZ0214-1]PIL24440.1 hypothetical protein GSI_14194 [Ganoderma sinense ZZ0214-1]PIL25763.1 hypothetical protein GSI_11513 [Ganoderma sinense ZZ0214-1]
MVAYVPPEPFDLDVACAILLQFAMFITAYFVRFIRKLLCYRDEPPPVEVEVEVPVEVPVLTQSRVFSRPTSPACSFNQAYSLNQSQLERRQPNLPDYDDDSLEGVAPP